MQRMVLYNNRFLYDRCMLCLLISALSWQAAELGAILSAAAAAAALLQGTRLLTPGRLAAADLWPLPACCAPSVQLPD